ncbi:MAG: sodium/proline symporter PutP [Legionellales bacterium]|nr:sodium/proline symporter PutP [Legionellales bacterium]
MANLIVFIVYFIVVLSIALYTYRFNRTHADYILGGRQLSGPVTAMGVGASDMSSWLMYALPGAVYLMGLNQIWLPLGILLGAYVNWSLVAKRLRVYTEVANDSLTIPAYFDNRFHDRRHILRLIIALVIICFFTVYCAAGFVAASMLFMLGFNLEYTTGLLICGALILGYTLIGGFMGVNRIDLLQGALMFIALLLVPLVGLHSLGGWQSTWQQLELADPYYLNAFSGITGLGIVSFLSWGLGYLGQPHLLVRFMAAKNVHALTIAKRICLSWVTILLICAVVIGLVGHVWFFEQPLVNPETIFLVLAKELFNQWWIALLFAAVLSAIFSTAAAQMLVSSSSLAEDGYRAFFRPQASERELLWVCRLAVCVITLMAMWLAVEPSSRILDLIAYAWSGIGAAFGPSIILSLFWRDMTRNGALTGIIVGAVTVLVWYQASAIFPQIPLFGLYAILPGFVLGMLGVMLGSRIGEKPTKQMLADFDRYQQIFRQTRV